MCVCVSVVGGSDKGNKDMSHQDFKSVTSDVDGYISDRLT